MKYCRYRSTLKLHIPLLGWELLSSYQIPVIQQYILPSRQNSGYYCQNTQTVPAFGWMQARFSIRVNKALLCLGLTYEYMNVHLSILYIYRCRHYVKIKMFTSITYNNASWCFWYNILRFIKNQRKYCAGVTNAAGHVWSHVNENHLHL